MTWQRVRMESTGWDSDLRFEEVAQAPSAPGAHEVLVEVEACGVCHRDLIDRAGRFPFLQLPVTPGHEVVGRVIAAGSAVSAWEVGDRVGTFHRDSCGACAPCRDARPDQCLGAAHVFGLLADGGYASHLVAPERAFFPVPAAIPAAEAAVIHCALGSAWRGLVSVGRVQPGEKVLITGANGGVGACGIQIARRMGAHVTAVVRRECHVAFVESLGAHRVVVDDGSSFHRQGLAGQMDLVLETVGSPTFNASLRSAVARGRISVVGNVSSERASVNLGQIVVRELRIQGPGAANAEDMAAIFAEHERDRFIIPILEELPLEQADPAQRRMLAGGLEGRLVLIPEVRS